MKQFFLNFSSKRRMVFLLFMLAGIGLFAQNVPELIYYKFDGTGSSVANDASLPVGNNPAPILGVLSQGGTGQFGGALQSTGGTSSANYVNSGWPVNLTNPAGFTISLWMNNMPSNTTLYYLFGDNTATSFRSFIGGVAGAGNIIIRGGGLTDLIVSGISGGPHVVHFVWNGTQILGYKDGVQVSSVNDASIDVTGTTGPFKVGGYSTSTGMPAGSMIDEFRVYDRALDATEIAATWNNPLPLGFGVIAGTVTSALTGLPISGALVTTGTASTNTNASGQYTLPGINMGTHNVTVQAAGYLTQIQSCVVNINQTTILDFSMAQAATITGMVFNADSGDPIIGAKVTVGTAMTYSIIGGLYSVGDVLPGTVTIIAGKAGFDDASVSATVTSGQIYVQDIPLLRTANPPGPLMAVLNSGQTAVDLSWTAPAGLYEIIYDDGTQDNYTVWALGGNQNAVKFTAVSYPVDIIACKVNIGTAANYPGGMPTAPFQMVIYDASGPGGVPGVPISDSIDVMPLGYGWVDFNFSTPVAIQSGNFYLVMVQGGNNPDAFGIAIDETSPQLRSYARFVTGGAPWIPANGNFMMRVIAQGLGGPLNLDASGTGEQITASAVPGAIYEHTPGTITGIEGNAQYAPLAGDINYQLWRLMQGQEGNQSLWTTIGTTANLTMTDNSWPSLSCGPYRWAVKAEYPGNRFSNAVLSNVLGKCNTAEVTVNVLLTCAAHPEEGTTVKMINTVYPDTAYMGITDTNGTVVFPAVWKGQYDLMITRFSYPAYTQLVDVLGDMTIDVMMLQDKAPPYDLFVDDKSLESIWRPPSAQVDQFAETFSGGFGPNQWVENPTNSAWSYYTGGGNPAPSARFYWSPSVTNYEAFLTSNVVISGVFAPQQILEYDVFLDNFGTSTVENMAIELWDGSAWIELNNSSNANGDIPWTTETIDITAYSDADFQLRFKAWGGDSYNINWWYVDNIYVYSTEGSGYNPCVLGYNFYLNNVQIAFTVDTTYLIPANLVTYGTVYNACVNAVYASGYSTQDCYTFTSHFLYPPINLQVEGIECTAYLTWEKPQELVDSRRVTSVQPRTSFPIASAEYSPMDITVETDYTDAIWDILFSWTGTDAARPGIEASMDMVYLTAWQSGFGAPPWFQEYDKQTGNFVQGFDIAGATAIRDMAHDGTYYYGSPATSTMYQMDFTNHTLVSSWNTGASSGMRHMCYDPNLDGGNGGFWTGNWTDLKAIAFDGTLLWNGPAPTSQYGSAFDNQSVGGPFYWAYTQTGPSGLDITQYAIGYSPLSLTPTGVVFNAGTVPGTAGTAGGLCASPVGTKFALIANSQQDPQFVMGLEIADYSGGGGDPMGLIGYKVYRDGNYIAYVSGKDTTWYYDFTVEPGVHNYEVSAWYDLTDYGFPGLFDESLLEGPATIDILCGRDLPFCEMWDGGSFAFNEWTFAPDQGNWVVSTAVGNPAPSADFSWLPITPDYSYSLVGPTLNAGPWVCASIWLDFDWKLVDRNATGNEMVTVEVLWNGNWHEVLELANEGSVDWTSEHIDISDGKGRAIKVRFTAHGDNSEDILHWYFDNICVYYVCNSPTNLVGDAVQSEITLTWNAPGCYVAPSSIPMDFIYDDDSWEDGLRINAGFDQWIGNYFPIDPSIMGTMESVDVYFVDNGSGSPQDYTVEFFDAAYNSIGVSGIFSGNAPDYWINVPLPSIPFTGPVYAMVHYNNLPGAGYYLACDTGGPFVSQMLAYQYDGTSWTNPTYWPGGAVFFVRGHAMVNADGMDATPVVITPQGVLAQEELPGAERFGTHASVAVNTPPGTVLTDNTEQTVEGYNVFHMMPLGTDYDMLNTALVADTFYVHSAIVEDGVHKYFVEAVFADGSCEANSDTIEVLWPAVGIHNLSAGEIRIFPNPATEIVNVVSSYTITNVEVMNFLGQAVYTQQGVDQKATKINVSNLQSGVYFVKVTTQQGVRAVKITVTH